MKHETPVLSFIIPIYNVELYLPACLGSVLHLPLTNFEIILIDDGSTDNSGRIADKYAENYSHIHVIHQTNAGLSATRNRGVELAEGNYIAFLDSDDWLIGDQLLIYTFKLHKQMRIWEWGTPFSVIRTVVMAIHLHPSRKTL